MYFKCCYFVVSNILLRRLCNNNYPDIFDPLLIPWHNTDLAHVEAIVNSKLKGFLLPRISLELDPI
jgi:hypothetical protein